MRKFIVLCLMAAIGAVAFIQHANAAQGEAFRNNCTDNPGDPQCLHKKHPVANPGTGQPPGPPPGQPRPQRHNWNGPSHNHWGGFPPPNEGANFGLYFGLDAGEPPPPLGYGRYYYPGQCRNIAFDLRDQGFERVRPIKCSGPRLVYSAWRDGEKFILYVSRDGRIRRILPAY